MLLVIKKGREYRTKEILNQTNIKNKDGKKIMRIIVKTKN